MTSLGVASIALASMAFLVTSLAPPSAEARTGEQAKPTIPYKAPEEFQRHRVFYSNYLVARYNALGLQNMLDVGYRYQLYDDDRPLFKGSYVGLSFTPLFTPAYAQFGASIKAQPLAILSFEARFSYMNFFRTFNLMQSFDTASAPYSDSDISNGGGQGLNYAGTGFQMNLLTTLQGKVGPVIVRSLLQAVYHDMNLQDRSGNVDPTNTQGLRPGTRVWYDQYFDMLLPAQGWMINNDLDVLVQVNENLILGARYTLTKAFYTGDNFLPEEDGGDPNGPTHRVGPMAAYIFYDEPGSAFNRPAIILIANWWLKHRWRTGQDVSQAIPYVVLGFAFSGDLL